MKPVDPGARMRAVQAAGAAAALLTLPARAHAAEADDPPSPLRAALRAPVAGQMRAAGHSAERERLIRAATRLARRAGRERPARAGLCGDATATLRERVAGLRREARVPIPPQLEAIAACESGGDPVAGLRPLTRRA
jgi:hypothetical protein